ncbi:MAG: hypothetical protein RI894_70, partial [Bacteroidota bacterium]
MLENAISNLKDGIENTIRRYPIAVAVALLATLLSWYAIQVENRSHYPDRREYLSSIFLLIALCSVAMPVVFSAHVIYNTGKRIAAIAIFAALPLLLWFFSWRVGYKIDTEYDVLLYFLWSAAGHFLAAIAAFWHADQLNGFWQWNKQLFLRFLTSGLYSSVLYLGIAGAILAVRLLFDWKMPDEVFAYLFVTIGVLFQSMFFLGGLSAPIEDLQHETDYPKGLKIFTQYVLLPLLGVYFVILYLYMGKIIVQVALPKGSVCFLILGFSVVGILSILLLHPLLDDENEAKWVRVVGKFFYFLLLPLTVLMFISIGVRLGDYGVTPNRYIMLLLAFWLFATCLYFIFSKKRNIIVIPASLMLISFFCSFGPWSVMQVSVRSQTAILKQLFIDNKLMKNDTLCALSKTQDTSVKDTLLKGTGRRIESILVALEEMGEMGTVKKWIPKTWQKAVFRDANNFDITVLQDKL